MARANRDARPEHRLQLQQRLTDERAGDRRPDPELLASMQAQVPDLLEALAEDRQEWARLALALADLLRIRTRTQSVAMAARAIYSCGSLRDAAHVLCHDWIENGLPQQLRAKLQAERTPDVRDALVALCHHAENVDLEPGADFAAAEQGLRWAAGVLRNDAASAAPAPSGASQPTPVPSPESVAIGLLMAGRSIAEIAKACGIKRRADLYEKPEWLTFATLARERSRARSSRRRRPGRNPDREESGEDR